MGMYETEQVSTKNNVSGLFTIPPAKQCRKITDEQERELAVV
jgi:hypothetical protein